MPDFLLSSPRIRPTEPVPRCMPLLATSFLCLCVECLNVSHMVNQYRPKDEKEYGSMARAHLGRQNDQST